VLRHVIAPDGVPIACEVGGVGPPLVLVHGAGSARWGFDALRPRLEQAFTVIAMDRRGRGDSGDGGGDYELAADFEDAAAVVRDAGKDALLFGHSYGALVAAGAATLLAGLPKLALYEPPMGGVLTDAAWIAWYEERLENGAREQAVRRFLRDVGGYTDAEMDQMKQTRAWGGRLAVAPTIPRELRAERALALASLELERLALPCLIFVGSESPGWAHRSTAAFAAALPRATVRTVEGHGHGGTVSAAELVADELTAFFS
jgi:pimeloyl-ACP methyl ester carboxylesterase